MTSTLRTWRSSPDRVRAAKRLLEVKSQAVTVVVPIPRGWRGRLRKHRTIRCTKREHGLDPSSLAVEVCYRRFDSVSADGQAFGRS
jgi:hypothetical protein